MAPISYRRHRSPPVVIQRAVWLYLRFTLSYRDVEELLVERGFDISYESVRNWVLKFGPAIARDLRRCRPRPSDRWHLDEMIVRIAGKHMYLWRAVDHEGEVLEEENGLEIDQSSLERRRPFFTGGPAVRIPFAPPASPSRQCPAAQPAQNPAPWRRSARGLGRDEGRVGREPPWPFFSIAH